MAAVLRSGVPSVPCPFNFDQPRLSQMLVTLGVSPCYIPYARLNTINLTSAVKAVITTGSTGFGLEEKSRLIAEYIIEESNSTVDKFCKIIESVDAAQQWKFTTI